jgi:hypothetical protein
MTLICTDGVDAKRELDYNVINEIYDILLGVTIVDLRSAYPGRVVYGSVLEPTDLRAFGVPESQERHINLDVVAGNPPGVTSRINGSATNVSR